MLDYDKLATPEQVKDALAVHGMVASTARLAGMTPGTLHNWVHGRAKMSLQARLEVYEALGYRVRVEVRPPRRRGPRPKAEA